MDNTESTRAGDPGSRRPDSGPLDAGTAENKPGADGEKRCGRCGRSLTRDEMGLHRKLINRAADSFFCISCNAEQFGVTTALLEEKIRQFREMGCTLFDPPEPG